MSRIRRSAGLAALLVGVLFAFPERARACFPAQCFCPAPVVTCCYPCYCYCPWWPDYCIEARLDGCSPFITPEHFRLRVRICNFSCSWLYFRTEDFHFEIFDEHGRPVHGAVQYHPVLREFWVPPCTCVTLTPRDLVVHWKLLKHNHLYKLRVCLDGRCSCVEFVPIFRADEKTDVLPVPVPAGGGGAIGKVIVSLPEDAELFVDGKRMRGESGRRVFDTPEIPEGREYTWTLVAKVVRNGEELTESAKVKVAAGSLSRVNFTELIAAADRATRPQDAAARATVKMSLPEDARVFVGGQPVDWKKTHGVFRTPPLERDKAYEYKLTIQFERDGKQLTESRVVQVRAGAEATVRLEPFSEKPRTAGESDVARK